VADRETISRVAKILARAGSDNPNESAQALQGAYKRMVRDGVSLRDLLSLPLGELYQDTLVKLIDVILSDQPNLSPSSRREAYSEYMLLIVARFSGAWDGASNQSGSSSSTKDSQSGSREEEARKYEERRRQQEAERGRGGHSARPPSPPPNPDGNTYSRQNGNTPECRGKAYRFQVGKFAFSFSPAAFFSALGMLFGRGSITWHALHQPGRALRLFAVSLLYGLGFAGVVLVLASVFHGLTGTGPLWDIQLKNAVAFLAALGFLFKCRQLFIARWF
jgi:hypothetical protein